MGLARLQLRDVNRDLPAWQVPPTVWTDASGMNFRDGVATRVLGSQYIYGTFNVEPIFLLNSFFGGTNFWLYGGEDEIGVVDQSSAHFDITPASWGASTDPDKWTGTLLNGVPVMNYEGREPAWWDRVTANPMTTLTGWTPGASCRSMRAFRDFLIAIGYNDGSTDYPDQLIWSDAADPGLIPTSWTPGATTLAGDLPFGDTPGPLIDGMPLRGQFVVYKQESTYLMQYVGGNFVFGKRKLFNTSGVLARNCIAEVQGNHLLITDSDIVIHDGQNMRSLVDSKTRQFLFSNIDQTNFANSYVFNFKSRNEVWFCFPTNGQTYPDLALVWDQGSDSCAFRDLVGASGGLPFVAYGNLTYNAAARPWDSQAYAWNSPSAAVPWNENQVISAIPGGLAADPTVNKVQQVDFGEEPAVGAITGRLERLSLDFDTPDRVKLVRRVWPRIEGADGDAIGIRVGGQFDQDDPIDWSPYVTYTIGTDRKVDVFQRGRYLSFEFASFGGSSYRITGFDVDISEQAGKW